MVDEVNHHTILSPNQKANGYSTFNVCVATFYPIPLLRDLRMVDQVNRSMILSRLQTTNGY